MRRILIRTAVLAALCALMPGVRAQIVGIQPTPIGMYTWNQGTGQWNYVPSTSTYEPLSNTPQAFAFYGFNATLGQWVPCTSIASCFGGGEGGTLTVATNGSPNASQTLLNFVSANGCSFTNPTGGVENVNCSTSQVYPGTGIANSTGTSWGVSYGQTGTGLTVVLSAGPTMSNATLLDTTNLSTAIVGSTLEFGSGGAGGSVTSGGAAEFGGNVETLGYFEPTAGFSGVTTQCVEAVYSGGWTLQGSGAGCGGSGSGSGLEMVPAPPITGQYAVVTPSGCTGATTGAGGTAACAANNLGGGTGCAGASECTATLTWTFTLPSYITQSNISAVYGYSYNQAFGNDVEGAGLVYPLACSVTGGVPAPIDLMPGDSATNWLLQSFTAGFVSVPVVNTISCTAGVETSFGGTVQLAGIQSLGLFVYYTGTAPPTSNDTSVLPPLYYAGGALGISLPYDFASDSTNTNSYNVTVPAYEGGPGNVTNELAVGATLKLSVTHANTSTAPTVSVNGTSGTIVLPGGGALVAGQLSATAINSLVFNGVNWELQNAGGAGIVYPAAGYALSTGSAWGTSHLSDSGSEITASEPISISGSTHGLVIPAGTPAAGATGSVVYASDATNGYAEVNEDNGGLSRICTVANGLCSGSVGVSSLNALTGALSITAGSGITVTPSGSSIAIALTGGGAGCAGSTAHGACYNDGGTATYSTDVTVDASSVPLTVAEATVGVNSYGQVWTYGTQPVSGSTAKSASMSFGDDNGANDAGGLYLFGNSIDNLFTVTNFTTTGGQIASFVDPNLASSTSTWLTIDFGGDTLTDFQGMLGFWDRGGSGSTTNMVGLGVGTSNDVNSAGLLIDGAKNVYLTGLTGYPSFSPTPSHPWQMLSPSGSSGAVQLESAYTTIQNAGSGVAQEPFLNFTTGASCVDDPSHTSTDCTINAAGLTLTTTGSSGAATLSGSTLNIPIYAASGGYPAAVTLTASSSSALDFTTCLSGSYSNYQITFTDLVPSSSANVLIQMSSNGGTSYDTGSNYWSSNQYWGVNTSDSGSIATNVNLTGFSLWGSSADNVGPYSGTFTMIAPGQSSEPVQLVGRSIGKNSAGNYYTQGWGDIYNPGTLVVNNAFRVILSTGTITSGTVTCQPIPQ